MQDLRKEDVLFDEDSFEKIESEEEANSYMRYYSKNVAHFRTQLQMLGWEQEATDKMIDLLWIRVLRGCVKYGVPFTENGHEQAKRLGIQ